MLSPSGPAKNSGKIVTMLMRSAMQSLDEAERLIDDDGAVLDVGSYNDLRPIGYEGTSLRSFDIEQHAVRKLIIGRHFAEGLAGSSLDFHPDQIVQVDLVLLRRGQLRKGGKQIPPAPE